MVAVQERWRPVNERTGKPVRGHAEPVPAALRWFSRALLWTKPTIPQGERYAPIIAPSKKNRRPRHARVQTRRVEKRAWRQGWQGDEPPPGEPPRRHESPPHADEVAIALALCDHIHRIGGADVEARRQIVRRFDRQPVEPHDLFPGQPIRETPAHRKISTARKMKTEAPLAVSPKRRLVTNRMRVSSP
jgi:hypothetical protein